MNFGVLLVKSWKIQQRSNSSDFLDIRPAAETHVLGKFVDSDRNQLLSVSLSYTGCDVFKAFSINVVGQR